MRSLEHRIPPPLVALGVAAGMYALARWWPLARFELPSPGLPAFVAYLNRCQIAPEERILEARFGSEYVSYRDRVRRWL